jgi:hypothetical protein
MKNKDEILDSVKILDAVQPNTGHSMPEQFKRSGGGDRSRSWLSVRYRWRHRDDDDDDPPPCPAVIAPFPRLPPFGAEAELEAA